jgi:class 3 adenylate cyclase/tetratricopeptide (TPR) repeat protein
MGGRPDGLPEGVLTFLLTDIEGSTPLWERHRGVMGAALAQHEALITRAVAAHAGRLIKTKGEGDSTLSVFARASDAAAAALALQQLLVTERWPGAITLTTRAALHTGEAELRGGDYYGPTLNRAARLRALGQGGQILLSRATAELVADQLPEGARLVDVGAHLLKGLSRPENVFALAHPDLPAPPPLVAQRAEHPDRLAFVGRGAERASLDAALDRALGGQGQLVLVGGEAGIGKTRIAEELAADARAREARVVWGRCHEGEGTPAYWPWRQALRAYASARPATALAAEVGPERAELTQLVPELAGAEARRTPASLDPEMARFRLFDAVSGFLRSASAEAGLVVVLDDLHWADQASLLLLEFVARELVDSRLLLVGTYRDIEVDRRHRLSSTLAELFRQPVTCRVTLGGLGQAEVGSFISNVAGIRPTDDLVTAVHNQTEGNPYFVSELVRLLVAEHRLEASGLLAGGIPEGIRHVIGRRLNRLSEDVNTSLAVASVQGREFDLDVVARAAGLPSEAVLDSLEEAMDARLVVAAGGKPGRFRFAHALVREALYDELPGRERRQLHDRVGAALVELRADNFDAYLAELAHHFAQSARPGHAGQAVAYARQAGDRAMELLAYEEAAGHYERALQALGLQGQTDHAERCELLLALAAARMAAGETAAGRAEYERAAALAKRMGAGEQLARAAFGLGVEFTAGTVDELEVRLLEEALTVLGGADSLTRARVMGRLARALQSAPDPDRRARLAEAAVAMARRMDDRSTLAAVLYDHHLATWGPGNVQQRLEISGEVVRLAETSGDSVMALRGRGFLMANLLELGEMAGVRRELETYGRVAEELRQLHFLWHVPLFRVGQELLEGRFDQAERLAEEARALGRRARDPVARIYLPIIMTGLRWQQGRLPELEGTLREFVDRYPANLGWRATFAVLLCEAGRKEEAGVEFERLAADDFVGLPRNHLYLYHLAVLAIVFHSLGDRRSAAGLYELLLPFADRNVLPARLPLGTLGSASQHLGLLAATMSRWELALSHFDAAIQAHERMRAPPLLARSRHHYALALLARGRPDDRERAQEHLDWASAVAERLGMRRLAGAAEASGSA